MSPSLILDVRWESQARRHELIFDSYSALPNGAAFVVVTDHDPKPLDPHLDVRDVDSNARGPVLLRRAIVGLSVTVVAPAAVAVG